MTARKLLVTARGVNLNTGRMRDLKVPESISCKGMEALVRNVSFRSVKIESRTPEATEKLSSFANVCINALWNEMKSDKNTQDDGINLSSMRIERLLSMLCELTESDVRGVAVPVISTEGDSPNALTRAELVEVLVRRWARKQASDEQVIREVDKVLKTLEEIRIEESPQDVM